MKKTFCLIPLLTLFLIGCSTLEQKYQRRLERNAGPFLEQYWKRANGEPVFWSEKSKNDLIDCFGRSVMFSEELRSQAGFKDQCMEEKGYNKVK